MPAKKDEKQAKAEKIIEKRTLRMLKKEEKKVDTKTRKAKLSTTRKKASGKIDRENTKKERLSAQKIVKLKNKDFFSTPVDAVIYVLCVHSCVEFIV